MEGPTAYHNLRGPSPIVWAMRTRLAPPPPLDDPPPLPPAPPPPPLPLPLPLPERRRRGRPRNCDRLPPPPGFVPSSASRAPTPQALTLAAHAQGQLGGLQPHVLKIDAGEDIISRIMAVSQINGKAICVLSVHGAVKEATLLQPSGVISNHKGPLEIIHLFGSILTSNDHGCVRVTLASSNSSVIGGIIAGPLRAATPVQAIVGSFHNDACWPNKAPKVIASYPNSQVTIGNGSTPSSEHFNPEYASCTTVEQNGSSEIDVKPSLGVA